MDNQGRVLYTVYQLSVGYRLLGSTSYAPIFPLKKR